MLDELKNGKKIVGIKQLRKALTNGSEIKKVFLAQDADPLLTEPIAAQCEALHITVIPVPTMKQLGAACSISVEAAVAAVF